MNANTPKILYFTKETVPTAEELLEIESLGFPVQVRNAQFNGDGCEPCAGVLGEVPECYDEKRFPDGKKVMEKIKAERKADLERLRKDIAGEKKPAKKEKDADKPPYVPGQ